MTLPFIQPDIEISACVAGGEKRWEISFFAPGTDKFDVQSKQASLRTLQDDSLSLMLEAAKVSADGQPRFDVQVVAPGRSANIAVITLSIGENDNAKEMVRTLSNELQLAFIKALRVSKTVGSAAMVEHVNVLPLEGGNPTKSNSNKKNIVKRIFQQWTWKRSVVASILLFGVGLIILGLIPARNDSLKLAIQGSDYEVIQAKVKKEITAAANRDQPSIGGLQGQAIAIETMKAMGLDPGKANAGCLVGVKK